MERVKSFIGIAEKEKSLMDFQVIAGHVVNIALIIFTPVLGLLGACLLRTIARKLKINMAIVQDQQVDWAVQQGVNYAEEWARTQMSKPSGNAKADKAFEIMNMLLSIPTIQQYGIAPLQNLIKAKVGAMNMDKTQIVSTETTTK